jgi:hypothetical protein
MKDSVTFIIGGEPIVVPTLVLYTLERAWPHIKELGTAEDTVGQARASLEIIAAGLSLTDQAPSADDLAKRLRPNEFAALNTSIAELLDVSGLIPKGEAGATMGTTSTAGSIPSSPSLQPTA